MATNWPFSTPARKASSARPICSGPFPARCRSANSRPHAAAQPRHAHRLRRRRARRRRSARRLPRGIGCTDVAVLDGGTPAWEAAGYVLFTGVNVPSKAFGEWVEHHYGTESIDAAGAEVAAGRQGRHGGAGQPHASRNSAACRSRRGISVPGGELAYRIGDLAPDPETLVVVNCAGRTRSIMGAKACARPASPTRWWRCATAPWAGISRA